MKFMKEMGVFAGATLIVILVFVFSGIFLSGTDLPPAASSSADEISKTALLKYQGELQGDFENLFEITHDIAAGVSDEDLSGSALCSALDESLQKDSSIVTIGVIDKNGIVTAMSPKSHIEIVGSDLSLTPVVSEMNEGMVPLMTDLFGLSEGGYAASVNYPVFSSDKEYRGSVSLTFDPSVFAGKYAKQLMADTGFQMMIVQKDGVVLYDTDPAEIGKETFGNPMYDDFPEVLEFAKAYSQAFSGEYEYSYLDKNLKKTVRKKGFWTTVGMHGAEWRLICIHEI